MTFGAAEATSETVRREHDRMTGHYLGQADLTKRARNLIRRARTRDTIRTAPFARLDSSTCASWCPARRREPGTIRSGRPDSPREPRTWSPSNAIPRMERATLTSARATPSVSVILPTFNRTKFLRLAVASVYAQALAGTGD